MHGTAWNRQAGILQEQENTVIMHLYFMYTDILFFYCGTSLGWDTFNIKLQLNQSNCLKNPNPLWFSFQSDLHLIEN